MRAKPGGADVPVVIGDMADVGVAGPYGMVYLVFNTLFNLVDGQRQADCFANVARVLAPGGAFVIEAFVPDEADFDRDEQVQIRAVTEDSVTLRVHKYNRVAQTFIRQTITLDGGGVRLAPFAMHYLSPSRSTSWPCWRGCALTSASPTLHRRPFGAASTTHVSVYRKS